MASSSTRKYCANSNDCKQPSTAHCDGCSKALCTKHFIDHRRSLGEEMDVIITEHDQLYHTLNQQTTDRNSPPLIKDIDEWEKESILKIQQKAKQLREQLRQLITVQFDDLSKKLRHLSEKLKESREHDSFVETDLQHWKETLNNLKADLIASPSTFIFNRDDRVPLVENISVNLIGTNELFHRVYDNKVRIEENGQVVVRDTSNSNTEIRGKNDYTSGRHKIRLRIEQSDDIWTFVGINSKPTPLQNDSFSSRSTYGWANNDYLWMNGEASRNTSAAHIEMKTNDIISMVFDCDHRKISMINERTNAKHDLPVNIVECPFPWKFHLILYEANSRIRILSNSS